MVKQKYVQNQMIVTINTDASFSKTLQRGSYAFWIVSNQGKIARSGILKRTCTRPEEAEFMCLLNAMFALSKSGWDNITKIVINTDCLNVIHVLIGDKEAIRKYRLSRLKPYKDQLKKIINSSFLKGINKNIRHIKAHQEISSAKQWVNDWCDQNAKLQLHKFYRNLK